MKKIIDTLKPNDRVDMCTAIQQDVDTVKQAWSDFCELCGKYLPEYKECFKGVKDGTTHQSWMSRILDDCEGGLLYHTFGRLSSISRTSGIEYQQPYFVDHEYEFIEKYEGVILKD